MIINKQKLLAAKPVKPMAEMKLRQNGLTYGMSEAGYDIRIKQTLVLHPLRRFRLASTYEYFEMPEDLVAIVHDKSTWARRGLSVFNTVIEPGWKGWLTLELVYHGWRPLVVKAGSGIAQVVFHELSEKAAYQGRYQNQGNEPQKAMEAK